MPAHSRIGVAIAAQLLVLWSWAGSVRADVTPQATAVCERVVTSGDRFALVTVSNNSDARVSYRVSVMVRGSEQDARERIDGVLAPGADARHALRPFGPGARLDYCEAGVEVLDASTPRLRHVRRGLGSVVLGQLSGGLGAGIGTALAVASARFGMWECDGVGCYKRVLAATYAGYVLGLPFGIKGGGDHRGGRGSYWATAAAAAAGGVIGAITLDVTDWSPAWAGVVLGTPTLLATAVYWFSHRQPGGVAGPDGIVTLRGGALRLGVPIVTQTTRGGVQVTTVSVAAGQF